MIKLQDRKSILNLYLTPIIWPTETESPIIRGAIPLLSGFAASHAPHTTSTNTKARKNSIPKPWTGVTPGERDTTPRACSILSGDNALNIPDPAIAPMH